MLYRISTGVILTGILLSPLSFAKENEETQPPQTQTASSSETLNLKEKNLIEGKKFLEENQKKPNITTLSTGLQYKIIQNGSGESPGPLDSVTVNYRGTLIDGTEFDSSYKRGEPNTFPVNAVIPGWSEALQLMKPGAKWMLYIPSHLAYGEKGAGRMIGPNAVLVFEVELIRVKQPSDNENDLNDETEEG